jgi:hypothetical protein
MLGGDLIGKAIDAVDQDAREQEIREYDDPLVPESGHMLQAGFDQREGHPRIAHLAPAKADAFLKHPGDLGHVAIGIRVRRAAPDHHKAGVVQRDLAQIGIGAIKRLVDARAGGGDHLGIDPKFAAVMYVDAMSGGIGIENRGDVVLGMHRGEQHPRHRQNTLAPRVAQPVKAITDHRVGKFQITVFGHPVGRQIGRQLFRQNAEFIHRRLAARAMATDHHTGFSHGRYASCTSSSATSSPASLSEACASLRALSPAQRPMAIAAPRAAAPSQWP